MDNRPKLICFPAAGDSAPAWNRVTQGFSGRLDVVPMDRPGHGLRFAEPLLTELGPMIDDAERQLGSLKGHYALLGHSMGGLLAFEVSRRLRASGARRPLQLFLAGTLPPQPVLTEGGLHRLSDRELIARLVDLGGVPEMLLRETDVLKILLPIVRSDLVASETWSSPPGPLPDCPVAILCGSADTLAPPQAMTGWQRMGLTDCRLHVLPAGHFFPQTHSRQFAEVVEQSLWEGDV